MPAESDNQIYRKVALERLSSPEQLDHLMKVTSPKGWLALTALAAVILVTLIWGIFGSIPTIVSGQGIFIRGGSVYDVVSIGAGTVSKLNVVTGARVKIGDVLAVIQQPELEIRIRNAEKELSDLEQIHAKLTASEDETLALDMQSYGSEAALLKKSIKDFDEQISGLGEKVADHEKLVSEKLLTKSSLLASKNDLYLAQQGQAQSRIRQTQVAAAQVNKPMEVRQIQNTRKQRIEDTQRNLALLRSQFDLTSQIRSPYAGRILEIVVDAGNFIQASGRLLSIERVDQELVVVTFVPAAEGKRVERGMPMQISPSTVKREEYGFIEGRVDYVSQFPSTPEGMMRVLRNNELVRQLSGLGAPIEVRATLEHTPKGYKWSSAKEPPNVDSGTLCANSIVVRRQPPISLVLPIIKKWFGGS